MDVLDGIRANLDFLRRSNQEYVLIVAVNLYTSYGTPGIVDPVRYAGGWTDVDRAVIEAYDDPDRDFAHLLPLTYVTIDSAVSQEYSAIMSDIATYVQQYTADVIIGNVKIDDTWDAYLAQLESMELAKATGYMQDAWDQYLAKEQYIP